MPALFGPAGNSESFKAMDYKETIQVPEYLSKFNLDAYEYQCGRGVKISTSSASEFGKEASKYNIKLSIHAPYYISLSSTEQEKREKSIFYIEQTAEVANAMGASRIIVHSGSCGKLTREQALEYAKDTIKNSILALDEKGLGHINVCPETMGKVNQLGDLYEVMELCKIDDRLIPCIDFGHLNARTFGGLSKKEDFEKIFETMENSLGFDRLKIFHSHFSKIEYTENGGEKRHLTFEDEIYGPNFEPVAEYIAKRNLTPTIICESAGTQAEDAKTMKEMYNSYFK